MKRVFTLTLVVIVFGLIVAFAVRAQQNSPSPNVVFVDAGWETHSRHGEGVFMVFKVIDIPDAIWANFSDTGRDICNAFSPTIVPKVLEVMKKANPAFVSITLKKGNSVFGIYKRDHYTYRDGKCE